MKGRKGFTIIELLIVIVVIAILAAIVIVAYNGIQQRATNTARANELRAWERVFRAYLAQEGEFPPSLSYGSPARCLGTGFPEGYGGVPRCRDYQDSGSTSHREADNAALMNDLSSVAQMPRSEKKPAGTAVGPYVDRVWTDLVRIYAVLDGRNGYECSEGLAHEWRSDDGRTLLCSVTISNP